MSAALASAALSPLRVDATILQPLPGEDIAVARRCALDHPKDVIRTAVSVGGYGLCDYATEYSGGEALYRVDGSMISFVGKGGGQMAPEDMELLYHVPPATARALVAKRDAIRTQKFGNAHE
jgi:hypothetical protein